jgi:phospholipid/cholesterol/gamma-HCH transport system substrate-binding protein
MSNRSQKAKVGLFVVVAGVLLAITLFVFGGLRMWGGRTHYAVQFDGTVMGLEKGAQVYLNGIRVGSVDSIGVADEDLGKVQIGIVVDDDTPVKTDTRAVLQMAGITGLKVIDLRDGTLGSPPLPPGSVIAQGETTLDKLEKTAKSLAEQSAAIVDKANRVVDNLATLTDPMSEIASNSRVASKHLAQATAGLDSMISENRQGLRQTIATVGATAASAQAMITENRVAVRETLASVKATATGAQSLMDEQVTQLVTEIKTMVRDNGGSLRAALADLRVASRSFKEMSREVRQKPSRLLFSGEARDRKLP